MHYRVAILMATAAWGLAGCQTNPPDAGYPPLPGPSADAEVVAVSSEIASAARPVFYFRDAKNSNRLLAYDWTGKLRGAVVVSASEPFGASPSSDGTMLLLMHAHVLSGGRAVGKVSSGNWAGDNSHLCVFLNHLGGPGRIRTRQLSSNSFESIATPGTLFYESVTGGTRKLLDYGEFAPHGGPAVLACSAANDRAVIGGSFVGSLSGLTMIRLSDGHVISRTLGGAHVGADGTVVSRDAMLLALGSTGGVSMAGSDAFTVFRLPGNELVAQIRGSGIEAFSADNTKVLTVVDVGGSNEQRRYQVIDLATSRSLWSRVLGPGTVLTRPGSGDFLVASRTFEPSKTRVNSSDPFEDVWLVSADGSARLLLQHASPLS
jgi:hypothetical protein